MAQINKPQDYFETTLYSGNGTADTSITGCRISTRFIMD